MNLIKILMKKIKNVVKLYLLIILISYNQGYLISLFNIISLK